MGLCVVVGRAAHHAALGTRALQREVGSDDVAELGVGGHTVVRGWAWPVGCQSSSAGQSEAGGVARGCQSGNPGQWQGGEAKSAFYYYCDCLQET